MKNAVCLRCDWTGDSRRTDCPECGAPLYHLPESTKPKVAAPPRSSFSAEEPRDENVPSAVPAKAANRTRAVTGVFVLVVALGAVVIANVGNSGRRAIQASEDPSGTSVAIKPTPSPTSSPSAPEGGLVGLAPEGAVPSSPKTGELVLSVSRASPFHAAYVYADGRLIWTKEHVGWLEQRLTLEGVELLRSGAVPLGAVQSQLPASVWEALDITPYVPSRYSVCYSFRTPRRSPEPSTILNLLPARAEVLLRGAERTSYFPAETGLEPEPCRRLTTWEAYSLGQILNERIQPLEDGHMVKYDFDNPDPTGSRYSIVFIPLLPHGEWLIVRYGRYNDEILVHGRPVPVRG
ncbi:MAG: hypothetical protein WB297_06830 [Actinomycetota bacterium]